MNYFSMVTTDRRQFLAFLAGVFSSRALQAAPPLEMDHLELMYYVDSSGRRKLVRNRADWQIRRSHILAGMKAVMGEVPGEHRRCPLKMEILEESRIENLRRQKVRYQVEPGEWLDAYLFRPSPSARPAAAVLCLQQTNRTGKREVAGIEGDPDLAYGLELARRGYLTIAPDYPGFGESRFDFAAKNQYVSGTMKAIWDNIRTVDLLEQLPGVRADRIGVVGHSLGGHNAIFTAAFEPRLRVIVSNCGFCHFHKDDLPSWTGPRYMPRIASVYQNDPGRVPFDFPEIIGSLAPRPFLAIAAQGDTDFDFTGVADCIEAAEPVYRLYRKLRHLTALYPETKHAFLPPAREQAYRFLDRYLRRGEGRGEGTRT